MEASNNQASFRKFQHHQKIILNELFQVFPRYRSFNSSVLNDDDALREALPEKPSRCRLIGESSARSDLEEAVAINRDQAALEGYGVNVMPFLKASRLDVSYPALHNREFNLVSDVGEKLFVTADEFCDRHIEQVSVDFAREHEIAAIYKWDYQVGQQLFAYDHGLTQEAVEYRLERALTEDERTALIERGIRPLTASEKNALMVWAYKYLKQTKQSRNAKEQKEYLLGTLRFLIHEGYLRMMDVQPRQGQTQTDQHTLKDLFLSLHREFCLTEKGLNYLNEMDQETGLPRHASIAEYCKSFTEQVSKTSAEQDQQKVLSV